MDDVESTTSIHLTFTGPYDDGLIKLPPIQGRHREDKDLPSIQAPQNHPFTLTGPYDDGPITLLSARVFTRGGENTRRGSPYGLP